MVRSLFIFLLTVSIYAQNNATDLNATDKNSSKESNNTLIDKHLQEAIAKEKKYEKEQKFYMGDEYNLSQDEVDPKSVEKVPLIEPEYDFDISDLYDDK